MAEWVEKGSIKGPPGEIPDVSDFIRDGDVSSAISGSSDKVASDKAVKDYVDAHVTEVSSQVSAEATARQEQDSLLQEQIGGKANVEHSHEMADVTGLNDKISDIQTTLDGKAENSHMHSDATKESSGFMSAADKAKLDSYVIAQNTDVDSLF